MKRLTPTPSQTSCQPSTTPATRSATRPPSPVVKNRLHIEVRLGTGLVGVERVAAPEAECTRLVALGATRVHLLVADGVNEPCLVMQDVEGNEFCLD
ncbi:VOC family protein [Streptomyces erythrochromogenes]|uniref:VOC family protein n=1 Tax=Streptomyces erythrochromogenes TaxID=285574 RepID=UPI0036A9C08F